MTTPRASLGSRRLRVILLALLLVLLVLAAVTIWYFFLRASGPPPIAPGAPMIPGVHASVAP